MPYKRKYKKRYTRKKTAKPKGMGDYTVAEVANAAMQGVQTIKRLINVEIKFHDVDGSVSSKNATSDVTALNSIAQGDTNNTRDGNIIKPQSLSLKGRIITGADASETVRVLIVKMRNDNGVTPTIGDILETEDTLSPYNDSERNRFTVLFDRRFVLHAIIASSNHEVLFSYGNEMTGHTRYVDGAATFETGGIYVMTVSTKGTSNFPLLTWTSRFKYTDN